MSISRYFQLSLLLLFVNIAASGQPVTSSPDNQNDEMPTDSLMPVVVRPFIRMGMDVSAIARNFIEKEVQQYEFSLDSEVMANWFATLEGGFVNTSGSGEGFVYSGKGYFARAGMDYNLLKRPTPASNDLILLGMRYGYSVTNHEAPEFSIPNGYWGDYTGSIENSDFRLHWIELGGGVKTEVLNNLYLGWTLRVRIKLFETGDSTINPYYIGGFGHGKRRAPLMAHLSLFYRINLW